MKAGFTLLELLVVLTIIAMLSSIAAVRLAAPYGEARFEDAIRHFQFLDHQTRTHARAFAEPSEMVFQLDRGRLFSEQEQGGDRYFEFQLPSSMKITNVVTPFGETYSGSVHISVSSRGASPSYAVCVSTRQKVRKWLLFCGLTGRVIHPRDEIHARHILKFLQTTGVDAH